MNKDWFIFKGTHHLGPFSIEEVAIFYKNNEISLQTLVWKEGSKKWEPLYKVQDFTFLFPKQEKEQDQEDSLTSPIDSPPPIPKAVTLPVQTPKLSSTPTHNLIQEEAELPPPIPLDALLDPKGEQKLNFDTPKKIKQTSKYFLLILLVGFLFLISRFIENEKKSLVHLHVKGVMPVYLDRLEMTAAKNSPNFDVALALSLDGQTLYASTNFDGTIEAIISLTSKDRRVLGPESVSVKVRGEFKDHLGKFTRMTLTKGAKFLPGEYNVNVEARVTHFLNRQFKSLATIDFFRSLNKIYHFKGEALIFAGTPREFEKKMADYKETLIAELQKPLQDKLERIRTFESILNQTSQNYLMELERAKTGKDIISFEKKFMKEISPLLQSLVVKANELANNPQINEMDRPGLVAPYREQVLLGKQIGEMASDMITRTSSLKKLTDKERQKLKSEFNQRSRAIKMQIDLNARLLEQELAKIK